jgi:hypothetical protein
MPRKVYCLVLFAVAAAALVASTTAGATTVPYKGSDVGTWANGTEPCPGSFIITTSGVATYLGSYTYSSHECATGDTTYAGVFTLTAANGDTITGTYSGDVVSVNSVGDVYYEQTNTVTGGSGRFDGATGSFHLSGVGYASGVDVQREAGTISSIGSSSR